MYNSGVNLTCNILDVIFFLHIIGGLHNPKDVNCMALTDVSTGESGGVNRARSVHIHTVLTRGLIRQQVKAAVWGNQASLNEPKAHILSTYYQSDKFRIQKRFKGF